MDTPEYSTAEKRGHNPGLRHAIDDLIDYVRAVNGEMDNMSDAELEQSRDRLMAITDVLWPALLAKRNVTPEELAPVLGQRAGA